MITYSKNNCKCNKKLLSGNQPLPHLKNTKLIKMVRRCISKTVELINLLSSEFKNL